MAGALHRGKEEYRISPESFPGVFRRALKCVEENTAGVLLELEEINGGMGADGRGTGRRR